MLWVVQELASWTTLMLIDDRPVKDVHSYILDLEDSYGRV